MNLFQKTTVIPGRFSNIRLLDLRGLKYSSSLNQEGVKIFGQSIKKSSRFCVETVKAEG